MVVLTPSLGSSVSMVQIQHKWDWELFLRLWWLGGSGLVSNQQLVLRLHRPNKQWETRNESGGKVTS